MKATLKKIIYGTPVLGPLTRHVWGRWQALRLPFRTSGDYWEQRYRQAGNSGAGSYGRLAEFKAEVLNEFVARHSIGSVVEFGSGDGNQLTLAKYDNATYLGLDVAQTAIDLCQKRFAGDALKSFRLYDAAKIAAKPESVGADLSMSLDVIYHLVEDAVFESYLRNLFACARRFVIIYSSDKDSAASHVHVRHRNFTAWVAKHIPEWSLIQVIPNRYPLEVGAEDETSFADFYIFARSNSREAQGVAAVKPSRN